MGLWHFVGRVEKDDRRPFGVAVEAIQQEENRDASLALLVREPAAGAWGSKQSEIMEMIVQLVMTEVSAGWDMSLVKGATPFVEHAGHPEVAAAMEFGDVRFVVGKRDNGAHVVGVVVVAPQAKSSAKMSSRPWWKFW